MFSSLSSTLLRVVFACNRGGEVHSAVAAELAHEAIAPTELEVRVPRRERPRRVVRYGLKNGFRYYSLFGSTLGACVDVRYEKPGAVKACGGGQTHLRPWSGGTENVHDDWELR